MTVMLRTFLLGITIFLFMMSCFSYFVSDFTDINSITNDPVIDEVYANYTGYLGTTKDNSDDMQASLEGSIGDTVSEAAVVSRIYSTIKQPFEQLKIVQSTTTKTAETFHVPRWMYYALLGMVITVLVAIFIGIVTRSPT